MSPFFYTKDLAVGYNKRILIRDINFSLEKGKILTLIGPNGAGKSTILKTVTRQIRPIGGNIFLSGRDIFNLSGKQLARSMAVVLTERIRPEMMTCAEVTAMGRYPYTDMFGKLTATDKNAVRDALDRVHALDLAEQNFSTLSDGQRQRIMLARAICQEPEILILDEPTAFLDIRYKIDLLEILRDMARTKGTAVIMSLHEIDLAMKISDEVLCLDGKKVAANGIPEKVLTEEAIEELYDIRAGSYNLLFGSAELPGPEGAPRVFVTAGSGSGTPWYRILQKMGIPFATGILFDNDMDCQAADALSSCVIKAPAYGTVPDKVIEQAEKLMLRCEYVLNTCPQNSHLNPANEKLLLFAEQNAVPITREIRG